MNCATLLLRAAWDDAGRPGSGRAGPPGLADCIEGLRGTSREGRANQRARQADCSGGLRGTSREAGPGPSRAIGLGSGRARLTEARDFGGHRGSRGGCPGRSRSGPGRTHQPTRAPFRGQHARLLRSMGRLCGCVCVCNVM
jgi:hypothetical protein